MGQGSRFHTMGLNWGVLQLSLLFIVVSAEISQRSQDQNLESKVQENFKKDCLKSYDPTCLKLDIVSFVDKLSQQDSIGILPGVSVVKQNETEKESTSQIIANLAREFPNDADKRIDAFLLHKIGKFLHSHAISIKLFDPKTYEKTQSFNEMTLEKLGLAGGQPTETARKKDKGYGGLMAGLMMMKGTLGALGFGALAMLAGKALVTGMMALMLSAILGLKSLSSGGEKKTTYEIVSKPVYSSSHTHSSEEHHGGSGYSTYGRSFDILEQNLDEGKKMIYEGNVRNRRVLS